jgi:hypothetical protein
VVKKMNCVAVGADNTPDVINVEISTGVVVVASNVITNCVLAVTGLEK